MARIEVLTGRERRRRWTAEERRQILVAAFTPGAVVADVAREFDVASSLIYTWRRQIKTQVTPDPMFARAVLASEPAALLPSLAAAPVSDAQSIVVEFANGARLTVGHQASASLASAILRALR